MQTSPDPHGHSAAQPPAGSGLCLQSPGCHRCRIRPRPDPCPTGLVLGGPVEHPIYRGLLSSVVAIPPGTSAAHHRQVHVLPVGDQLVDDPFVITAANSLQTSEPTRISCKWLLPCADLLVGLWRPFSAAVGVFVRPRAAIRSPNLNGTGPIDHGAAHVTPSLDNAYAGPFPLRPCIPLAPLQPAGLHRPRWRLAALSAIYPRVFTAIHTLAVITRAQLSGQQGKERWPCGSGNKGVRFSNRMSRSYGGSGPRVLPAAPGVNAEAGRRLTEEQQARDR